MDLTDAQDLILIGDACDRLAVLIGEAAARSALQEKLRSGGLQATADRFQSSGPWRHSGMGGNYATPEQACQYTLPAEFWNTDFAIDGERTVEIARGLAQTVFADWGAGNFAFQHRTPNNLSTRNASGVRVTKAASETLLARYTGTTYAMTAKPTARPRGRPSGGGYRASDQPLIEAGVSMLREGKARSAHHAAVQLAQMAQGTSEDAKVQRLRRQIKTAWTLVINSAPD